MGLFHTPSAEDRLLRQARQGDRQALEHLVQAHQAMAYTVALRVVGTQPDAEEVVQDAFLKAFGALAQFQHAAKFSTWLYRIVYNTALSKKKSQLPTTTRLADSPAVATRPSQDPSSGELLEQADRQKYVALALNRLPPDEALVLTLHYLGEKSIAEICAIMSKNPSAVKMQLLRARKQLARELSTLLPTELSSLL